MKKFTHHITNLVFHPKGRKTHSKFSNMYTTLHIITIVSLLTNTLIQTKPNIPKTIKPTDLQKTNRTETGNKITDNLDLSYKISPWCTDSNKLQKPIYSTKNTKKWQTTNLPRKNKKINKKENQIKESIESTKNTKKWLATNKKINKNENQIQKSCKLVKNTKNVAHHQQKKSKKMKNQTKTSNKLNKNKKMWQNTVKKIKKK